MNEEDFLDAYHGRHPYSYGSRKGVKDFVNVDDRELETVLSKSEIYTGYKEFKKPKFTPPIRTYGSNYLWEADLMFFTHPDFAKANDGKLYILAIIDTFTKMVSMVILKTKETKFITQKVNHLFNFDKPKYLRVDGGGEFISKEFTDMCRRNNVKLYVAMEPIKCSIIERFNRTFKRLLVQMMEFNNSIRWSDFVVPCLEIYHSRKHSSLKMSPRDADQVENESQILKRNLKRYSKYDRIKVIKNRKPAKFRKGQIVKIFKKKTIFSRGYHKNVTQEFFKIYHIDRRLSKDRYYLKDLAGEKLLGSFYSEYLVPFSPADNVEYKIDPTFTDFKRKNIRGIPHIWVKWLGWPKKFNQWVPVESVARILPNLTV